MERLRERPDVIQGGLRDFLHLFQIAVKRRSLPHLLARAAQHRSNGGEHLTEFIVKLAGNMSQSGFLCGNKFLRQVAALLGKIREARKKLAIAANEVQAGQHDGNERGGEKEVKLALYPIIDFRNAGGSLLFALVVFDKQARNRGAECLFTRLERQANLFARLRFFAALGKGEHAVDGVPELRDRLREIFPLVRRAAGDGQALFDFERGVQVLPDAFELRGPRRQGIALGGIQHVSHGQRDRIEIVLNAQQLQRILAVAIHHLTLKLAQTGELHTDVGRVSQHGSQGNDQAEKKAICG